MEYTFEYIIILQIRLPFFYFLLQSTLIPLKNYLFCREYILYYQHEQVNRVKIKDDF